MVNPRDIAGNAEEEEGKSHPNGEPQRYSWECRRRRRKISPKMVNPRDIAGNTEEEEEEICLIQRFPGNRTLPADYQ